MRNLSWSKHDPKDNKPLTLETGKAEAQSRRNEKLARRNPDRLQKQYDDLKALETGGGKLTSHEQRMLEELEKDIKAVKKAREALGDSAPKFHSRGDERGDRGGRGGRGGGVLGKRRRDDESDESDVPDDVKSIPMPRDTPPPIPKEVLDKWYQARREKYAREHGDEPRRGTNANNTPLGAGARQFPGRDSASASPAPAVPVQTVYEAKPVIRDLRKEAVSAFVPAAVRVKLEKMKGTGGLVEPEEADRLEREGYVPKAPTAVAKDDDMGDAEDEQGHSRTVYMEDVDDEEG